ncbi:thiamine kinase [Marinomonas spartinae]|uniref:choline/ethanolamine kinase family protein n=1 Tax=Marinomonas spartinae TaxID=1792290 RepID=UPI000808E137|nr:choline/ethanolamine kinase family protein [Marinomonas spartinae]SBS25809.1 thiamine kinase [Marinomonas spartinae]
MVHLTDYFDKMANILPEFNKIKVVEFEEGFSNKVYRLDWNKAPRIVLRVPELDGEVFGIDRQSEMTVLLAASQAGVSPPVLWHDTDGAFACRFVVQPSLGWDVAHSSSNVVRIAQALAQAHCLPSVSHAFCIYRLIEQYLQSIDSFILPDSELKAEWSYLQTIFSSLPCVASSSEPVVCHNDLNPKNVLINDEKIWLIDWEYTGMGEPLFDLAVVAKSHNLDEGQQRLLIRSYDNNLDEQETLSKIALYSKAYSLREMAWLLLKHVSSRDDVQSLAYYYEFKAMPSLNPFIDQHDDVNTIAIE